MTTPIKVITSGAFAAALKRLAPLYAEQTGQPIDLQFGSSIGAAHDSIPTRLSNGQQFDILVLAAPALEKFILDGTIKPDSRIDLAGSKMAAAVRASDPVPDLSTLESFKQVLLSTPELRIRRVQVVLIYPVKSSPSLVLVTKWRYLQNVSLVNALVRS